MPENENKSREAHASWKAPEGSAETKETEETKPENTVKFDPNKRPGIPHGARFKGRTVFHEMAQLWDEAKAEHDYIQSKTLPHQETGGAVQRYEEYVNYVNRRWAIETKAMEAANQAIKEAGLTLQNKDGQELYDQVKKQYANDHFEPLPQWLIERRAGQDQEMKERDEKIAKERKEERLARRRAKEQKNG